MSEERRHEVNPVNETTWDEGDLLPDSVQVFSANDLLTEQEFAMCDGEGGSAPSKGTRWA